MKFTFQHFIERHGITLFDAAFFSLSLLFPIYSLAVDTQTRTDENSNKKKQPKKTITTTKQTIIVRHHRSLRLVSIDWHYLIQHNR